MKEEAIKALKQFGREDLIDSPYGYDIDDNIEIFMTIRQMIKYNNLQSQLEAKEEVEKKFIKYLEYQVKLQEELNDIHLATGFEEILSKYKEIIGYDK